VDWACAAKLPVISHMAVQASSRSPSFGFFPALSPRYFASKGAVSRYLPHLHSNPLESVHDSGVNTREEQDGSFRETEKGMNAELNQHIGQLRQMTPAQLQLKYREVFGQPCSGVPSQRAVTRLTSTHSADF